MDLSRVCCHKYHVITVSLLTFELQWCFDHLLIEDALMDARSIRNDMYQSGSSTTTNG